MKYVIKNTDSKLELSQSWEHEDWQDISELSINCVRPEGSEHRPETKVKLIHNDNGIRGIFKVKDKFVRCVNTGYLGHVYKDSCVEMFIQPNGIGNYFNFEFNCGGNMLASYKKDRNNKIANLCEDDFKEIKVYHNLPEVIEEEITEETIWYLEFFIPFSLMEKYAGKITPVNGNTWRANFYKCGDETSHPHWISWAPVDKLDFHLPHCFGQVVFE